MDLEDKFDSKFSDVCMNFFMDNFIEDIFNSMKYGIFVDNLKSETILRYPFFIKSFSESHDIEFLNLNICNDTKLSFEDIIKMAEEHECDPIISLFSNKQTTPELFEKYLPEIRQKGDRCLNEIYYLLSENENFYCKSFNKFLAKELFLPFYKKISEEKLIKKCNKDPTYITKPDIIISSDLFLFHLDRLYPLIKDKITSVDEIRCDITSEQFEKYSHLPWNMKTLTEVLDIEYIKKHPELDWDEDVIQYNPTLKYEDCLKLIKEKECPVEYFLSCENLTFNQIRELCKDKTLYEHRVTENKFTHEKKIRRRIFDQEYLIREYLKLDF